MQWGDILLLVGAFAWAAFITDVNVLDSALDPIADVLDDIVFGLIGLARVSDDLELVYEVSQFSGDVVGCVGV